MNKHADQFRDTLPPEEVMLEPSGQFGEDLRNFRATVHRAAEREMSQSVPFGWLNAAKHRRRRAQHRVMLAWATAAACAALLFAATLPLMNHPKAPVIVQVHQSTNEDTALLEEVDTAVSESVPSSLAPLDALDDWNTPTSTKTQNSLNKPEKKNVSQ
jgi:type II secretory pathway component PulM